MKPMSTHLAHAATAAAFALASLGALAAPSQAVVQSIDYGLVTLPHTQGFSLSIAPMDADQTFLSDYGFTIANDSSFSGAVVTFDLNSVLQLSNLSITLLNGNAWSGAVPSVLTPAQVADRDGRVVATGSGSAMNQVINQMTLPAGSYVVEVSGRVTGSAGGSFGGLLNVAAVPEPAGFALALAGLGMLALARRRVAR